MTHPTTDASIWTTLASTETQQVSPSPLVLAAPHQFFARDAAAFEDVDFQFFVVWVTQ